MDHGERSTDDDQAEGHGAMRQASPPLSDAASWQLLAMVYNQSDLVWANALLIVFTGTTISLITGQQWLLVWIAFGLAVSMLRLLDFHRFHARMPGIALRLAQRRFTIGVLATALTWGAISFEVLTDPGPTVILILNAVQAAYVASAVARYSAMRKTAMTLVYAVLLPACIAFSLAPFKPMRYIALLTVIYIVSCLRIVIGLNRQSVMLILAGEENALLLAAVTEANVKLEQSNTLLEAMASTDGLTGIANRRSFDGALATEWRRAERDDSAIGLLLIDIDNFKSYNDTLGHQVGDDCLKQVAACIAGAIRRPGDFAARYGGEEFAVILPLTDAFGAIDIGEHIRCAVQGMHLPHPGADLGEVTISVGMASLLAGRVLPDSEKPPARETLVAMADAALYCAKRGGRNRVCGNSAIQAEATSG